MLNKQHWIDKIIFTLLIVIFGGIVVHAPMTVWLSTLWPDGQLIIKSWKEILMLVVALLMALQLSRLRQWRQLFSDRFMQIVGIVGLFDLLVVLVVGNSLTSELAGLLIGLRYYLYFGLVYWYVKQHPKTRQLFVTVFLAGALAVGAFSLLQVFVLPKDILSHIGYSDQTIKPYVTVDLNPDYPRINGTLRGPNPLGAYAVIVLSVVGALWVQKKLPKQRLQQVGLALIGVGAAASLWWSYSRSALVGVVVAFGILAAMNVQKLSKKGMWVLAACVLIVGLVGSGIALTQEEAISNIVFHTNTNGGSATKSDDGHKQSLEHGMLGVIKNPQGHGMGSSGSASLLGDEPNIIENQYIGTAWQSGIIGLGLTLWLFVAVMVELWKQRHDYLATAVLISGGAMAVIGLVLPVWTDDTVSIIWWGLAALAIAVPQRVYRTKTNKVKG